jgi:hypothetical protein
MRVFLFTKLKHAMQVVVSSSEGKVKQQYAAVVGRERQGNAIYYKQVIPNSTVRLYIYIYIYIWHNMCTYSRHLYTYLHIHTRKEKDFLEFVAFDLWRQLRVPLYYMYTHVYTHIYLCCIGVGSGISFGAGMCTYIARLTVYTVYIIMHIYTRIHISLYYV